MLKLSNPPAPGANSGSANMLRYARIMHVDQKDQMAQAALPIQPYSSNARSGPSPILGPLQHMSTDGLGPGLTEAKVGLLPGLRTKYMEKYDAVRTVGDDDHVSCERRINIAI
jgi:hypothetical protein